MGNWSPVSISDPGVGIVGGDFYAAVDAATGEKLWGQDLGGTIDGSVITYAVSGVQKVTMPTGFISPARPVQIGTSRVATLGIAGADAKQ